MDLILKEDLILIAKLEDLFEDKAKIFISVELLNNIFSLLIKN